MPREPPSSSAGVAQLIERNVANVEGAGSRPVSRLDCAYAAGLLDGKGSIRITHRRSRSLRRPERRQLNSDMSVSNTDLRPLIWLKERWGGSIHVQRRYNLLHQEGLLWRVSHRKASQFLSDVLPYLIIKRALANNAMRFMTVQRANALPGVGGLSQTVYNDEVRLYNRHCDLQRRKGRAPKRLQPAAAKT